MSTVQKVILYINGLMEQFDLTTGFFIDVSEQNPTIFYDTDHHILYIKTNQPPTLCKKIYQGFLVAVKISLII